MKKDKQNLLLAAALALPLLTLGGPVRSEPMKPQASPLAPGERGPRGLQYEGPGGDGPGGHGQDGPGRGGPERGAGFGPGPEFRGPPPFLRGVTLTEAQQDKVFVIVHGEAPSLREYAKASAKARAALRTLASADQFDDAKAAALAKEAATADANIMLQHVRTQQKLLAVLTPAQRKQLAEDPAPHPQHP